MAGHFIDDSLTLDGAARGLRFTYRPATAEEVQRFVNAASRATDRDPLRPKVDLAMKHVVSWEAKRKRADGSSEDVPLSPASLKALRFQTLAEIVDVITGYAASADGDESDAERDAKN